MSIISLINLLINFKTRPNRDYQVFCGLKVLPSPIKINHRNSPKLQSLAQGLIIGNWCQSSTERGDWLELCQWELRVLTPGGGTGACEPACNQTKISQITNNWFIIFLRSYNDVKLSGFPQDVFFLNFQLEMNLKFWSWTLSLYPVVKRLILSIGPPQELVLWYNGVWEHYYLDEFNWNLMITLLEFWWRKWGDTLQRNDLDISVTNNNTSSIF